MMNLNHLEASTILIACLVTDKKYRKMGGDGGLKAALKRTTNRNISICQVPVEEVLKDDDDFEGNLKRFITEKIGVNTEMQVILVHKYSDFYKIEDERDRVVKLRSWLQSKTSTMKILDDPEKIDLLSNRTRTGHLVRQLCSEEGFESRGLQWPKFSEEFGDEEISVPVIIKPVNACATDESHWMTLISDPGVYDSLPNDIKNPGYTIIQQFYPHHGILYKVYVIGSEVIEIVARPSISASQPVIRFNTHKFKTAEGELSTEKHCEAMRRLEEHVPLIFEFTRRLKSELKLTWFGVDVIITEDEVVVGSAVKVAVIDVNYMPGYDGIMELPDKIIKAILE